VSGPPLRVLGRPAFSNEREQPYNAALYRHLRALGVEVEEYSARRLLRGGWSILHLHWPDRRVRDPAAAAALARSAALLASLDAARLRGTRVVWTAHNLQAHDGRFHLWLEPRYWRAFARRVDGVIALSPAGLDAVRERHPVLRDRPGFVVPIGHYRAAYPRDASREQARDALELPRDARVVIFFGQLRAYKGVPSLVHAFRALPDPDARLLVVGMPKPPALAAELAEAVGGDPRVRLVPRFVPDDEVQLWLRAADLVALPYREILNSGSAVLALSFDRPVLVPRRGAMGELEAVAGPQWVRTYEGELTTEVLDAALRWAAAPRAASPDLSSMEWGRVARLTLLAYRDVLGT
jgi:glycosyltransferase involved in cell wall biosynthesis